MTVQTYSKEEIDRLFDSLERVQRALRMRMAEGSATRLMVRKRDARIKVLEAALIEPGNGKIFCLACHNHAYTSEKIQHRKDCLLFPRRDDI